MSPKAPIRCAHGAFVLALACLATGNAAAATFTVTSSTDDATGAVVGTLSWAITQANTGSGHTIVVHDSVTSITVSGTLPALSQATTVVTDGSVALIGSGLSGTGSVVIASGSTLSGETGADYGNFANWTQPMGGASGGIVLGSGLSVSNLGTVTGGKGGDGGDNVSPSGSYSLGPHGGPGADGSTALSGTGFVLDNTGQIVGGEGGEGGHGAGGTTMPGSGDYGGAAGSGVGGDGFVLYNSGSITGGLGGIGGLAGATPYAGAPATDGANGVGVRSSGGATIVNSGTIAGGGTGPTRANAMALSGGGNTLVIEAGGGFVGNVVSTSGAGADGDALVLGGDVDAIGGNAFDLGSIGAAATFRGFASFGKSGASTWTLTGSGQQDWTVGSGTLLVDGTAGSALVYTGATLGGSGQLADIVVRSGGILAPGNSIGTLQASGSVSFAAGSTYEVEIAGDGTGDRLRAETVTIDGGTVEVAALDASTSYLNGTTYRIVDTTDGRTGTFSSVSTRSAFIVPVLVYDDANAVDLSIFLAPVLFQPVAQSANQRGAAAAFEDFDQTSGSDALAVFNQLLLSSSEEAQRAFDLASGEVHADGQHVIDQTFSLFAATLGAPRSAGSTQTATLSYGPEPGTAVASLLAIDAADVAPESRQLLWLTPMAGRGMVSADGNGGDLAWQSAGLGGGYEGWTQLGGGDARFGIGLGYLASHGSASEGLSDMDGRGGYAGIYGDWVDGPLSLGGTLSYGATHVATSRDIVIGGLSRTAVADYWTQALGGTLEAGYDVPLGDGFVLTPTGTVEAGWSHSGGATETGAGSLNATIEASDAWQLDVGIGAALAHRVVLDEAGELTLRGKALWMHGFGDTDGERTVSLAGGGDPFAVRSAAIDRNQVRLGIGADLLVGGTSTVSLDYTGQFSRGQHSHIGQLGLKAAF